MFIDEIHNIMGAGAAEGAIDAANIMKPQLARGKIQLIGATTFDELKQIYSMTAKINDVLKEFFMKENIRLIDFKIEFGRYNGEIVLADEISPDTCRLWDAKTNEKLDKDRFRRDLGNVKDAYVEILNRIKNEQ